MKIRLMDAEIRLRLTQIEVDRLGRGELVSADVVNGLSVTLRITEQDDSRLAIVGGSIVIGVPRTELISPGPDTPLIHEFQHGGTAVVIELDLGRRPR